MQVIVIASTGFVGQKLLTKPSIAHVLICPVLSIGAKKSIINEHKDNANIQYIPVEDTVRLE